MSTVIPSEDEISLYPSFAALDALRAVHRAGLLDAGLQAELGTIFLAVQGPDQVDEVAPVGATEAGTKEEAGRRTLIPRRCLVEVARWARSEGNNENLELAGLAPSDYTLIALQAGSKTATSPAQDRLIASNPDLPTSFLPTTSHPPSSTSKSQSPSSSSSASLLSLSSIGPDLRSAAKDLSAIANILFSVLGVGGGVWWAASRGGGMGNEKATLLAFLSSLIVAFAEIWLYVSHRNALEKHRRLGEEAYRMNMRRDFGARPKVVETSGHEATGEPAELEKSEEGKLLDGPSEVIETVEGTTSAGTAREKPIQIRLRRKPLPGGTSAP